DTMPSGPQPLSGTSMVAQGTGTRGYDPGPSAPNAQGLSPKDVNAMQKAGVSYVGPESPPTAQENALLGGQQGMSWSAKLGRGFGNYLAGLGQGSPKSQHKGAEGGESMFQGPESIRIPQGHPMAVGGEGLAEAKTFADMLRGAPPAYMA